MSMARASRNIHATAVRRRRRCFVRVRNARRRTNYMQGAGACAAQALAQPLQLASTALSIPEVDMNKTAALGTSMLAASMIVLAGCDKPATPPSSTGPMEKMGQKIDQAAERTKEQAAQATDKAGQALEDGKITAQVKA